MEFLKRTLRLNVKIDESTQKYPLPNYIISRYIIHTALFDRQKVFLLYPKTELEPVNAIRNHIQKIQTLEKIPVVVVLTRITARQRQNMVDAGIPFIVENKQCYLPFLGTLFTEKCDAETESAEKLIPSAQMLLFYYIYRNQREIYANEAVEALGVSAMTITRAVRQLEQVGIIHTYKNGVKKVITSECTGKELFEKAKKYMFCPIHKKKYIRKEIVDESLLISGDQALSMYSMLNTPRVNCYATGDTAKWKDRLEDTLIDDRLLVELQLWKYDPRVLAKDSTVDVLSLAMCYVDDPDERVEEAVEEMLEEYWRNTNGQRV
jgi:DNA-binding MarR family transcriptional regulator